MYAPTFGTGISGLNDVDKPQVIKTRNGYKHFSGAFVVTAPSQGMNICTLSSEYACMRPRQVWITIAGLNGEVYPALFNGTSLNFWGVTPTVNQTFWFDCWYL